MVIGWTIELRELELIIMLMVRAMKVNGWRTNSMEKVQKFGQMVLNMWGAT